MNSAVSSADNKQVRPLEDLRVAIVHPFLIAQGGGEKVIDALAEMLPRAEFFTLMLEPASLSPALAGRRIHTTWLDRFPGRARFYQYLSPLYDLAVAQHDLTGFDLVISSGGPGAKTVRVPPQVPHVHYCHSPVRFLWDQYETWIDRLPAPLRPLFALTAKRQRARDFAAAQRVDRFVANAYYIGARIRRYYARDSVTVYPPVSLNRAPPVQDRGDYYLTVGRLVPNKRTDLLIEVCNALGRRLVVAGSGPELARLRAMAGPTVEVCGRVSDERLARLYRDARAYLFAADEDFGIATVEAMSFGLPVIAYGHGGTLEIVAHVGDGVLFAEQSASAVAEAVARFEAGEKDFDASAIQRRAERFGEKRFVHELRGVLEDVLARR